MLSRKKKLQLVVFISQSKPFPPTKNIYSLYSTAQILGNIEIDKDNRKARKYFEGSLKFMATLNAVLDKITDRVKLLAEEAIYNANYTQIYGLFLLGFVMILSPILVILAKNAITSIQVNKQKYFF